MATADKSGARRQRGFTLVELMVTLTVAAVMLTTSVPALRSFSQRNQASSAQATFMASLALARAEAARRGSNVFIVAVPGGSTSNEYVNGWDLYADSNGNGSLDSGDGASIRHYEPLAGVILHGAARITFNPSGYLSPASTQTFRIVQSSATSEGYLVTLPPSGSADVSTLSAGSGG